MTFKTWHSMYNISLSYAVGGILLSSIGDFATWMNICLQVRRSMA